MFPFKKNIFRDIINTFIREEVLKFNITLAGIELRITSEFLIAKIVLRSIGLTQLKEKSIALNRQLSKTHI